MAKVRRFDIGGLSKPVKEPNGWMRVDAYLTRTGVFTYMQPDGTQRREYRPPDEVFKADSLKSFEAVPFTNDHPPVTLDATNTKQYQVGHLVGAPKQDGDKMRATILVTDAGTIGDMEVGKLQISNGYLCDLEERSGTSPDGERFDAIQRNIVGNHVALVNLGRAGPEVRARLDAADGVMLPSTTQPIAEQSAEEPMVKIKIDGVEVEVSETAAQILEKQRAAHEAAVAAAKTDAEKAAARADSAAADLAKAKADAAEAPKKARAEMEARVKLEETARQVLGKDVKTDGVDSRDLKRQIAATQAGDVKLDEKSDAYVEVLFDKAVAEAAAKRDEDAQVAAVIAATKPVEHAQGSAPQTFHDAARERFRNAPKNYSNAK